MAYKTLKMMIKYKRKSKETLLQYCDAYLSSGKITDVQYEELKELIS